MLLLILVVVLLMHFYWLPNYLKLERSSHTEREGLYIELLGTALVPGLITNDIAQVHETLNRVLKNRKHWYAITLHNADNIRLFPLREKQLPDNLPLQRINYRIVNDNRLVGRMELWIDVDSLVREHAGEIGKLENWLLVLVLVISAAAALMQDRWIRSPLQQLLGFAHRLSEGKYDTVLTHRSNDELGELVTSLDRMRMEIRAREEEVRKAYADLSDANSLLEEISNTDAVTRIYNRRYFDQVLANEIGRASRLQAPIAVLLCDIDYFKNYNDTYGHQQGDFCLREVATAIKSAFSRAADVVARYGGEEFGIVLPNTDQEQALMLAQRLRERVNGLLIPHQSSGVADHVTVSIGVAVTLPEKDTIMSMLIEQADKALYEAKNSGRNAIRIAG